MSKQPDPSSIPDLYPEITSFKLDDKLVNVLRQNGQNPTKMQSELDGAITSGDMRKKAGLLEYYAGLTDRVQGNSAATGFLTARRRLLDTEQSDAAGSVSKTQALFGLTGNGMVDLAESLPKLATFAYGAATGKSNKEIERVNKSVENFFAPMRTYVSDDYLKGIASYSSETGIDINLDAKSVIGTVGNLAGFLLPGLLTAGAGTLATIGTRVGLKAAQVAGNVERVAELASKLGKTGKLVEKATGISSFLQMFPGYQKEGLDAGLNIRDATLIALPMAALNGWIETANVGALTKALGMSDDLAKKAIREVTTQEVRGALQGMAGKALSPDMFMDVAESAAKSAIGRISRPKEMSMVGRMLGAAGRRVGTGLRQQGITEGGEEFLQSIVENASKDLWNNFGAATGASEGNGKFKDPKFGNYVFDALYGTLLGSVVGTSMGSIVQSKKLDPTVFGYINADVRMQLAKGVPAEDILGNLKINKALDAQVADGKLDQAGHDELKSTIARMADTAREFAEVDGFTDSDRYLMYRMSEARQTHQADSAQIAGIKNEYTNLVSQLGSGTLSTGEQLKAELRKNALAKQLGGQVIDPAGNPSEMFQAEEFVAERAGAFENIAAQTLAQYSSDAERPVIKNFFQNNYSSWQKKYGKLSAYEDSFTPENVVVDPASGETLAFDADQKFFRVITPTGGTVTKPMSVNETGKFVPSTREPLDYDYSVPVSELPRHIALSQTLAEPNNPMSQSVQPYERADNSAESGWLRDGEELINTLSLSSADPKAKKSAKAVKELAQAYLTDSAFLSTDARYGAAYGPIAEQLQSLVGTASGQTTVPGTQSGSPSTTGTQSNSVHTTQLPNDLAGAKPRYGYQGTNFLLRFISDVDRALYVTSQTVPSKRDAEYRRFLTRLGYNNAEIGREGVNIRNSLKAKAQTAILNGAVTGDVLKINQPIAAEPIATQSAPSPQPIAQAAPQPNATNGKTPVSSVPDVQQPAPAAPTLESEYAEELQQNGAIESAKQAESEFEQALDQLEQSDGIPDGGTLEQLIDALERVIASTSEATRATATESDEQSVDQSDTPADFTQTELVLPEGPLTLSDALNALTEARGVALSNQFEFELMTLLRYPKFLQDSMLFYGTPPEQKTKTGRTSTKRRPDRDMRMRLPIDFFQSAAEVLAGQRKEQTSPAADQILRKFLSVFVDGGVEIDDRVSGNRVELSLAQLGETAAITEETIPAGSENIDPVAVLAADELLDQLTEEDIDAILSVVDQIQETSPENWLEALNAQLASSFPPLSEQAMASIDEIVENYADAREGVIFDNGDESDPEYKRAVEQYATATSGLQSALANRSADPSVRSSVDDSVPTQPGTGGPTIQQQLAEAGNAEPVSQPLISPDQFEQAVTAAETEGRTAIESAERIIERPLEAQSADQTTETLESTVAALEAEVVPESVPEPAKASFVPVEVRDDLYKAFRQNPSGYELSEELKYSIAQRIVENSTTTRDMVIYQNRRAEIDPYVAKSRTSRPAKIREALSQVEAAISQEASQDPITAAVVAPLDIELADLTLQENRLVDELTDEDSPVLAEDAQIELEEVRENKKDVLAQKIAVVEQAIAAPQPTDTLQQRIDELDAEEVALAQRFNAKMKSMRNSLNANPVLDPELIGMAADYFGLKIKKGVYQFAKITRDFVKATGEVMDAETLGTMRQMYGFFRLGQDEATADQMDSDATLRALTLDQVNAPELVLETNEPISAINDSVSAIFEPDSGLSTVAAPVIEPAVVETNPVRQGNESPDIELTSNLNTAKANVDIWQKLYNKNPNRVGVDQNLNDAKTKLDIAMSEARASPALSQVVREELASLDAELNSVNRLIDRIYDTEGETEADRTELGSLAPERKFKKALVAFSKQTAVRLGWNHDVDKSGKTIYATTNIPPAGGDGGFILWHPSGKVGLYVNFTANKLDYTPGRGYGDRLTIADQFLWRLTRPENKYSGMNNQYAKLTDKPYAFAEQVTASANAYLKTLPDDNGQSTNTLDSPAAASAGLQFGLFSPDSQPAPGAAQRANAGRGTVSPNRKPAAGSRPQPGRSVGDGTGSVGSTLDAGPRPDTDAISPVSENIEPGRITDTSGTPVSTADSTTGTTDVVRVLPVLAPVESIKLNPNHFTITNDTVMYPTGRVGKIKANIDAIRLMKELVGANRVATPAEKAVLVQFTGWGGLKAVLDENKLKVYENASRGLASSPNSTYWQKELATVRNWYDENAKYTLELKELLTKSEFQDAVNSVINAHYTARPVIQAIWTYVKAMGFKGGRVLEPATGAGHFIGLMPTDLVEKSQWWGTELDTVTGNIAKLLYPDASIQIKGFEAVPQKSHFFDLVISNVPFGQTAPFDAAHQDLSKFNLHNYFIAKSIRLAKPGGIVAVVTSAYTMDSTDVGFREWVNGPGNADLVGAVRLPSNAFKENAGTDVTTDVLFFRKRDGSETEAGESFRSLSPLFDQERVYEDKIKIKNEAGVEIETNRTATLTYRVNEYFARNPEKMLGEPMFAFEAGSGGLYGDEDRTLRAKPGQDTMAELARQLDLLPKNVTESKGMSSRETTGGYASRRAGTLYRNGSGTIVRSSEGVESPVKLDEKVRIAGKDYSLKTVYGDYLALKEGVQKLRAAEATAVTPEQNENLPVLRRALKLAYTTFTAKYGNLNKNRQRIGFLEDADVEYAQVAGLELVSKNPTTGKFTFTPSQILSQRVQTPPQLPTTAANIQDAVTMSLAYKAKLDLPWMASLLNRPDNEVQESLLVDGLAFMDPATGLVVDRESYLSGNVRNKLAEATAQAEIDQTYQTNVTALESVIPKTIPMSLIELRLGSSWVPTSIYQEFMDQIGITNARVSYLPSTQSYAISGSLSARATALGTSRVNTLELIDKALNLKQPNVVDYFKDADGKKKSVKNVEETARAQDKMGVLMDQFVNYVKDTPGTARLAESVYNETYNSLVAKKFLQPPFTSFPGANPAIQLREHQIRSAQRALQDSVLLAHGVGTGKAQPLDAKLLTPYGWMRMGLIEVGDMVISQDGTPTRVTGVYPQGHKEIFEVTFSDGSKTECCDEHLWYTQTYYERSKMQEAIKLGKLWNCGLGKVRDLHEIRHTLRGRIGAKNHSIPLVQPVQFTDRELKLHPYLLGVLLGDGSISHGFAGFSTVDEEMIDHIKGVKPMGVYVKKVDERCNYVLTKCEDAGKYNEVIQALKYYKLQGTNSLTKFIPFDYLFTSIADRVALLQGLLDTDGTIDKRSGSISYFTISDQLANDVVGLVQGLGGTAKRSIKFPKFTHKGEVRNGQPCHILTVSLPNDIRPFALTRKMAYYKPKTSYQPARYITEVKSVGFKEAQCISVENPSHLYVTDDYIVTHNTFTMITAAMEMKRLGLAQKPMIVVQNSTLENFANAWRLLYPGANLLVPASNETDADNRQRFLQRMAYNNWDGVIIPQSFMALIPDNQDRVDAMIQEQIDTIQNALDDTDEKEDRATAQNLKARMNQLIAQRDKDIIKAEKEGRKKMTVADAARSALKVTKKVSRQASRRTDAVMTFEELGVDALFLDEAHEFKKFGFYTQMANVKGIDTSSSQKALSAMLKVKWVQERNAGRNVVLATGTPISNTMAELWTMLKYVAPELIQEVGISNFDQFAANFGSVDPSLEFTAAGKFKVVDRFKRFVNMPELQAIARQHIDVVLGTDVFKKGDNTLPQLKDDKYTFVELEQSPELKRYMDYVKNVLIAWEKLEPAKKKELRHIPLVMFTRAKQAAIDVRLVDPNMDVTYSKVNSVAENVLARYELSNAYKGTQLVFSNSIQSADSADEFLDEEQTMPNPLFGKGRFNLYDAIIEKLIEGGIPANEIAIVPEDASKREKVFVKVRTGEVRVIFGSTERLGVGVNIQDLVQSAHHIDAPVRPMDFEQRNGRVLRQGNFHAEWGIPVEVVTYGVKKTLDATAYQRLAFKQEFINQFLKGDSAERNMEDVADDEESAGMGFAEMMASLSGSQYVQLQQQRKFELNKVKMAQSNWSRGQTEARDQINKSERSIAKRTALLPELERDRALVQKAFPDGKVEYNTLQIENEPVLEGEEAKKGMGAVIGGLLSDAGQKIPSSRFVKLNGYAFKMGWDTGFSSEGFGKTYVFYEKGANFKGESQTADGLLVSIRAAIKRIEAAPAIAENAILSDQENIEAYEAELKKPFRETAKLEALEAEVADLELKMQEEFENEQAEAASRESEEGEENSEKDVIFEESLNRAYDENAESINHAYGSENAFKEAFADVLSRLPAVQPIGEWLADAGTNADKLRRDDVLLDAVQNGGIPTNSGRGFLEQPIGSLIGKRASTPQEIAALFALYRSPNIEKLHLVFTNQDGTIVGNSAFSLGLSSRSELVELDKVSTRYRSLGATSFYLIHNHPSGNHTPSDADFSGNQQVIAFAQKNGINYGGHVILDTTAFTFLSNVNKAQELAYTIPVSPTYGLRVNLGNVETGQGKQNLADLTTALLKNPDASAALIVMDANMGLLDYLVLDEPVTTQSLDTAIQPYRAEGGSVFAIAHRSDIALPKLLPNGTVATVAFDAQANKTKLNQKFYQEARPKGNFQTLFDSGEDFPGSNRVSFGASGYTSNPNIPVAQTIADMRVDAQDRYETIPTLAIGAGVDPDLWDTPLNQWSAADKAYAKTVREMTGWELTAPQTLKYTRPADLFHTGSGEAVRMAGYQINQILTDGFVSAYENQSARGRLFRTVVDRMKSWTNLETFLDLLDDAAGTINVLIKDLKRATARRASYAQVILEPLRRDAERKLADFSLRGGNSLETVRTLSLETYDYDDTGGVITREVDVPVGAAMEMVLLAETQLESYGETSHFVDKAPSASQLYRVNEDGSRTRWKRGAVYYDAENDTTDYLLMDKSQLDVLRDRFGTGNGGYDGEADAFASLQAYYNQAEVVRLLEEENGFLNPDKPFDRVADYYPIRTFNNQTDARTQSRGFSRTLDESRQLIERSGASDAVLIRDPITTMTDYEGSVVDILEHGRLIENINGLLNGIATDYNGPRKQQIVSYLENRRDDYQNHRKKRAEAYEQRGFVRWLETGMRRYTQSVFSLNIGLPLKQTGTYAAAMGQGIIDDEFLRSGEATGTLALLTGAAYRDWEARSTVVNGTDEGFKGSLSGMDTQERPYLEEIFGAGMPDDLSKSRQIKRFATVLDRLTHSQTLYTGDVEWADMGLNSKTLTNAQKALRSFDEWNTEYGLAAMKRADRAVILSYYTAAKLQAESEGLPAGSEEYWDRVADLTERVLYATNQMSNLTEMTPMQTSTDFVAKILGLYSGQQQKLLNTVMQALNKYVKTGEGSEEAKAALLQLAKTFGWSVLFNAAYVSAISAGSAALLAILAGDEPKPWEETKTRIGFDFLKNIAGTVPGLGSQSVEYWLSQMDDRPGTDPLMQITAAENIQTGLDIISGTANYLLEEDEEKREKSLDSVIYDVSDFIPKATGVPSSVAKIVRENLTVDKDDLEE